MATRSFARRMWYGYLHVFCRLFAAGFAQVRVDGRKNLPRTGGVLVLCNHQSYFDPVLVGLALDRRLNYLARETLFRFLPFRLLINSLDAIPIDRDGFGLSGIKETLRRLKDGELVLLFPEGTRTRDGNLAPIKPGFGMLAKRAKVPLLPMAIDGAYEAWPRGAKFPGLATIQIAVGAPITADEVAKWNESTLVAEVQTRMQSCFTEAREKRGSRVAGIEKPVGHDAVS